MDEHEPTIINSDTAYIMPHARNKGFQGYILGPKEYYRNNILNEEQLTMLLRFYTMLLEENNEQTGQNK